MYTAHNNCKIFSPKVLVTCTIAPRIALPASTISLPSSSHSYIVVHMLVDDDDSPVCGHMINLQCTIII